MPPGDTAGEVISFLPSRLDTRRESVHLFAYQGIARFHSGSAFAPWFFRIVTNTARQRRRRAASRREVAVNWQMNGDGYGTLSTPTFGHAAHLWTHGCGQPTVALRKTG
jgi:DNA-directed RNA polymerase specialized sigma24 family protein